MERKRITVSVLVALFAALAAAGAFIKIPMVPVPMTLQTLFALLAATCLPPLMAISSIAIYLFLGAIGLPIFTGGGGIGAMIGPTGGFLVGMLPSVAAGALVMQTLSSRPRLAASLSAIAATAVIYLIGLPWLAYRMDMPFMAAAASGFLPFIAGDTLKIIVTVAVAPVIRPRVLELLERES